MSEELNPKHCVAVIGGAVAGAEVAGALAEKGSEVVVFEQNPRPYGKIEDGLPRWHLALREKEYQAIRARLTQPGVHFVPNTQIGRDFDFRALTDEWGFTGVVLACGAWRDRPLPLEGADAYVDKGLIYQNPFILWFNHYHEDGFSGKSYAAKDGVIVLGGGLASIDVAKALMLETARDKLRERGIEVDVVELEVKGIPKILAAHDLKFEDLGLEGCTNYYRRREEDMPLVEIPSGATPEREAKVRKSREKLLAKAKAKYRFKIESLCMPDELIVEDGQLVGLRFRRTRAESGKVVATDETFERRAPYVISSIGSIPEPIEGIDMKGELFDFKDWELGRLADYPSVFSAGNVVTGKGNIVASRKHARALSATIIESYLGLESDGDAKAVLDASREAMREAAEEIAKSLGKRPAIEAATLESLRKRVRERQQAVGYEGDLESWVKQG